MNTRIRFSSSPRRTRGLSLVTVSIAVAIVLALAAAVYFLILLPYQKASHAEHPQVAAAPAHVATTATPPPADVAAMSTDQLLAEASKAIKDQRLLAPKGNNAVEFYLKVLDRQPDNRAATDALREIFPFAANATEQVINAGDFSEADREIGLLGKAEPDNYTLTILRSKLDARRKVRAQEKQKKQELAQQQQQDQQAAARKAEQAKQEQLAQQQAEEKAAAARKKQQAAALAKQKQQEEKAKEKSTPAPVNIQNAVLVKRVKPRYPPAARRMRRQGWVEVEYTVGVDGKVRDAKVVAAQPRHVFDREALRAVSRWVYKPALRNGKPMRVTMRKRIEFKMSNG